MLSWLVCQFAPQLPTLLDTPAPPLPEPSLQDDLAGRTAEAFAALEAVPWEPRGETNPYRVLLGMGCQDLVTREADQNPETAGRRENYAPYPAFQPVQIPVEGGPTLTGRHSTGPPGAPVVLVVHGLFDSHVSSYVVEYSEALRRWGFHVVALDLRDHGRLRGTGPGSLGLHEGRDLFAAARTLSRAEGVSVGILGLSYGGQCAVRAAHEATLAGEADVLRGGVLAIGAPLDIQEAVLALDDPSRLPSPQGFFDRLAHGELLRVMRRHLRMRMAEHGLRASTDVWETFVREVVLTAYPGEPGLVGSFLGKARSTRDDVLGRVQVPVALVHPADDPLVPVTHLERALEAAGGQPFVCGRRLAHGGHVGLGAMDPPGTLGLLGAFFGRLRDG